MTCHFTEADVKARRSAAGHMTMVEFRVTCGGYVRDLLAAQYRSVTDVATEVTCGACRRTKSWKRALLTQDIKQRKGNA